MPCQPVSGGKRERASLISGKRSTNFFFGGGTIRKKHEYKSLFPVLDASTSIEASLMSKSDTLPMASSNRTMLSI